jgi:hypothetical protein
MEDSAKWAFHQLSTAKNMAGWGSGRHRTAVPLQIARCSANPYGWPTVEQLAPLRERVGDLPELCCQVLEHKWYLSERP